MIHATTVNAAAVHATAVHDRRGPRDVGPAASIGTPVKAHAASSRDQRHLELWLGTNAIENALASEATIMMAKAPMVPAMQRILCKARSSYS